jgi:hypothetical protein
MLSLERRRKGCSMQRIRRFATAALPCLLASACAVMEVGSDYYRAVDFSKLQTYAWIAESPLIRSQSRRVEVSAATVQRIREAIERELAAKSLEQVATREQADLAIAFTVGARDTINVDDYPPYYRGDWAWRTPYYGPGIDENMYTEGTLAIDIFDNARRGPVWHGWARKTITGADVDDPESTINAAVAAILAHFPPG